MNGIPDLRKYSYRLYIRFIKAYMKPTGLLPTEDEQDSVKAFCVLAHAALEEYFELLADSMLKNASALFDTGVFIKTAVTTQTEIDQANIYVKQLIKTLIIASSYSIYSTKNSNSLKAHKSKIETASKMFNKSSVLSAQDLADLAKSTDSYARDIIDDTSKHFKGHINKNHGASLKYILNLLIPVGIDVPQDTALNSLQKLAKARGEYAHATGAISSIVSPPDVARYLIDIIKLCQKIENSMVKL